MGGVEGETPGTAVGGGMTREDAEHVQVGLGLVDDYFMSEVTAGHVESGSSTGSHMHTLHARGSSIPITREGKS